MRRELLDIKRCGLSIETFEALLPQTGLQSFRRTLWLVNPHYQQKFGLRPRRMPRWAGRLKYLRNYASTSCWYLLGHTAGKETEEQHPCGKKKQEGKEKIFRLVKKNFLPTFYKKDAHTESRQGISGFTQNLLTLSHLPPPDKPSAGQPDKDSKEKMKINDLPSVNGYYEWEDQYATLTDHYPNYDARPVIGITATLATKDANWPRATSAASKQPAACRLSFRF